MKKYLYICLILVNTSGCGIASGIYNTASTPVQSTSRGLGNIIGAGFIAAKPEQGNYTYPMTQQ